MEQGSVTTILDCDVAISRVDDATRALDVVTQQIMDQSRAAEVAAAARPCWPGERHRRESERRELGVRGRGGCLPRD